MSTDETEQRYLVAIGDTVSGWDNPEDKLRKAFAQNEFILYGQSIVKLASGGDKRPHFEVFVRLLEEEQNLIPPGTFLPMLEHFNLGPELDRYVVRKLLAWFQARQPEGGIAHLNLCSETFEDKAFCSVTEAELKRLKISGDALCFEFPSKESDCPPSALALAKGLSKIGCRISVGASDDENIQFRQMRELGASFLKVGRTLIQQLTSDDAAAAEVKTAARACRSFDVQTIAQHVEDAPTLNLLRKLGISFAQGYGISRPGPLRNATKSAEKNMTSP